MSVEIWSGEELVAAAGFWFCSVEYSDDPEPNAGENANIMAKKHINPVFFIRYNIKTKVF